MRLKVPKKNISIKMHHNFVIIEAHILRLSWNQNRLKKSSLQIHNVNLILILLFGAFLNKSDHICSIAEEKNEIFNFFDFQGFLQEIIKIKDSTICWLRDINHQYLLILKVTILIVLFYSHQEHHVFLNRYKLKIVLGEFNLSDFIRHFEANLNNSIQVQHVHGWNSLSNCLKHEIFSLFPPNTS